MANILPTWHVFALNYKLLEKKKNYSVGSTRHVQIFTKFSKQKKLFHMILPSYLPPAKKNCLHVHVICFQVFEDYVFACVCGHQMADEQILNRLYEIKLWAY